MQPIIELKHVGFTVKTLPMPIIDDISLAIYPHDFLVILGSNGSGKSSLLKLISQRYTPTSGQITFDEKTIADYAMTDYSRKVVTISQAAADNLCLNMTVLENARLYHQAINAPKRGKFSVDAFAEHIKIFNPKLLNYLRKRVNNLSGGEQQMLVLGLTLMRKPRLLLLDEHTSALDPKTSAQIMELTYQRTQECGVTCAMTTHHLEHALGYGNRLIAIADGRIQRQFGRVEKEGLTREALLRVCYG